MDKGYFLYKGAGDWSYAASMASTWIWAPALFVSSSVAHNMGLAGLLWFLIPNTLTLIIFGHVAAKFRRNGDEMTLRDVAMKNGIGQARLHTWVAFVLLICSTVVQLLGIHTLLISWFCVTREISAAILGMICFALVWRGGLRTCIETDVLKYKIVLFVGLFFAAFMVGAGMTPNLEGYLQKNSWEVAATFGITTAIGLLSAPYIDQTFWQRVFSIHPERVTRVFYKSAVLFALVPLCFGYVGLCAPGNGAWDITWVAFNIPTKIILSLAVLSALISTLDSNLCAVSSLAYRIVPEKVFAQWSMVVLFALASLVFIATNVSIVGMFLFYGTLRTCLAVPTILMVFERFHTFRLFGISVATVMIVPLGYAVASRYGYGWVFTALALILPLIGYSRRMFTVD